MEFLSIFSLWAPLQINMKFWKYIQSYVDFPNVQMHVKLCNFMKMYAKLCTEMYVNAAMHIYANLFDFIDCLPNIL